MTAAIEPLQPPSRSIDWSRQAANDPTALLDLEWLVTNGIGGYASGTVAGVPTRRYHGLLIAALPEHGRSVMLNQLSEELRLPDGTLFRLGGEERHDALELHAAHLAEFRLEMGLPIWRYAFDGVTLEKRLWMPYGRNTVHLSYRLLQGAGAVELLLAPAIAFRPHDAPFEERVPQYTLSSGGGHWYSLSRPDYPPLLLHLQAADAAFVIDWDSERRLHHRVEAARGYQPTSTLLRPGHLRAVLSPQAAEVVLSASTESRESIADLPPAESLAVERERRLRLLEQAPAAAQDRIAAELVLAADPFIVTPGWRQRDPMRGHAGGLRYRSIIAGYHWFTDWGRDTMISLEGLTLCTGRQQAARDILWTFAQHIRNGLIPNLFPEGAEEGLYHTADGTLWFFHALDRYLAWTGDRRLIRQMLPKLHEIVQAHLQGTDFGIGVDPADGLLRQGAPGYQLTWMDAKVEDWVVTPRRGKAVEINALWYNALRLTQRWTRELGRAEDAAPLAQAAQRCFESFNRRFWYAEGGYCYDVVDSEPGSDDACRPNQVFALALPNAVLAREHWQPVMRTVDEKLLTPYGLRSLAPGHADYKPAYFGDLKARDAAYHQGTVWSWLIGPYVEAFLKLRPTERDAAARRLDRLVDHLDHACIGSVSEIFDAEAPYAPRGCIAQAWSVAELLRCRMLTRGDARAAWNRAPAS